MSPSYTKSNTPKQYGKWHVAPIYVKLKARNLYLIQGLSHQEIAHQTGLTVRASEQLAHREGWTKQKKERATKLVQKQTLRMEKMGSEVVEAIGAVSEQHALRGLTRVGEALESTEDHAARNFQSWTGGVRNLVSIMRELRPADEVASAATLSVFVLRVGDQVAPKPEAPVAEPAVEVSVTPVLA